MPGHTNVKSSATLLAKWRLAGWREDYVWARGYTYYTHMYEVMQSLQFFFNVKDGTPGMAPVGHFGEGVDARFRDGGGGVHPSFGHALYNLMDLGSEGITVEQFYRWAFLATLAHDLGKAGGEFQEMLWCLEDHYQKLIVDKGCPKQQTWKVFREDMPEKGQSPLKLAFDAEMRKSQRYKQAYRHEFLSALILGHEPAVQKWFRDAAGSDEGFVYVVAGALGHHLKGASKKGVRDQETFEAGRRKPVFLSIMGQDINRLVQKIEGPVSDPLPPLADWAPNTAFLQTPDDVEEAFEDMVFEMDMDTLKESRVSAAVKWMVILADSAGSSSQMYNEEEGRWESAKQTRERVFRSLAHIFAPSTVGYKSRALHRLLDMSSLTDSENYRDEVRLRLAGSDEAALDKLMALSEEDMDHFIATGDRLALQGFSDEELDDLLQPALKTFQRECASEDGNLIAAAATGSGKTIGALAWASAHPHKRLVFCTPTTDTATRLFYDYADPDKDLSRHSRARMDVPKKSEEPPAYMEFLITQTPEDENAENARAAEEDAALSTMFRDFDKDIVYTTADQVLGVLAFYRNSVMWLPYLLSSQIVFDEFHSYDDMMRGWYFKFLEWFPGIRTAHLSATVPRKLQEEVAARTAIPLSSVKSDDSEGVKAKRYRFHLVEADEAEQHFKEGTLWICNTVSACQQKAQQFDDALVYHSRYRHVDRNGRREGVYGPSRMVDGDPGWSSMGRKERSVGIRDEIVEAFDKEGPRERRALATQVAEMSLDISARSMITHLCPPTALIQRIGRVNRYANPEGIADIYVYYPKDEMSHGLPYSTKWSGEPGKNPGEHKAQNGTWEEDYGRWYSFIEDNLLSPDGVSQAEIDAAFQSFYEKSAADALKARGYESRMVHTVRHNLRHGSVTTQSVLRSDLDAYEARHGKPMPKGMVKWAAVPAILTATQRKSMRDRSSLHERHYVIDDVSGHDLRYCPRLGLYDPSKI